MWFWCQKYTILHQWSGYGFNAQNHLTGMSNCLLAIKALEILTGTQTQSHQQTQTHKAKQMEYVTVYVYKNTHVCVCVVILKYEMVAIW